MNKRKGLSLIVLVITILVMLILSGVVIVSLSKNNPVEKAKEAVAATDIASYKDELNLNIVNELTLNTSLKKEDINENTVEGIKKYIPSLKKEHENIFIISAGELEVAPNKPKLDSGMIPIKYEKNNWVICSETDPSWYNYTKKEWANVMLSDGTYKDKNLVGQVVQDSELGSMFVWIPRYAYSINEYKTHKNGEQTTQNITDVEFLIENRNIGIEAKEYPKTYIEDVKVGEKTPKIVHPAFTFGEKELTGIWTAKFESSMAEENNNTIANNNVNTKTVKTVPNKVTWRYINIGNCFDVCLKMKENKIYGLTNKVDTHLMKNNEWGAIAYLTYSKYGVTPITNSKYAELDKDKVEEWAGAGDYRANVKQSTTGNITGIYDMNGGAWEYVAAYWDNQNSILQNSGGSKFKGNKLNPKYAKYWNKYEVNNKEIEANKIDLVNIKDTTFNSQRKEIVDIRYNFLKNHKGDAMYEVIKDYSYLGVLDNNLSYKWIVGDDYSKERYGYTYYNGDISLMGYCSMPFLVRGGHIWNGGIVTLEGHYGYESYMSTFRPVITM